MTINNDKNTDAQHLPDTTEKKDGTTSAFSAASGNQQSENIDAGEDRKEYVENGEQGRASFYTGTTTQGGSNHGQGSSQLGPSSYKQGSETSKGTNYTNETGKFSETGAQADGNDKGQEEEQAPPQQQGGTDAEHDETVDKEQDKGGTDTTGNDTLGVP